MQNIFFLPIPNLSCLPSRCSSSKTVLFNFAANLNFPLCAPPPPPTRYLLLHFQQNPSNVLSKPNAVGRMTSHPAPAYICRMCHSPLRYSWDSVYQVPNQCGDGTSCQAEGKEKGERKDKVGHRGDRGNCCLQRGLAENTPPGAAGGLGFHSPRKRAGRKGRQQSQGSFLLNTCNGRGKTAKAQHGTALPKEQNRESFWMTFQMLLLHHRDLTSWELLIKTLSDKAMLNSKHALPNYIPR